MYRADRSAVTLLFLLICLSSSSASSADEVLDWNATLKSIAKHDGENAVNQANPGWATRSMAMMNGAMYDVFQAISRTHTPFLIDTAATAGMSRQAAVNQAAHDVLLHTYPGESDTINMDFQTRMALVPEGAGKQQGIALGQAVAKAYIDNRQLDHADETVPYAVTDAPGHWEPDPYHSDQVAWGPGWGNVTPFALDNSSALIAKLPSIPPLDSPEYAAAYNQVKDLGDIASATRTAEQTEIGVFWGYDRATMGPPPLMFLGNLVDIAVQAGNTPEQNARLFAQASVGMADAAIAAWDAKFLYDFWRPVTAIHEADSDNNPATHPDTDWRPLGAPGDPTVADSDFTPPFPAWPSGHATMGAAVFETLRLFYGTNHFDDLDGISGNNLLYELHSEEMNPSDTVPGVDDTRQFSSFSAMLDSANPDYTSPEWENAISRVYLGIHWVFDAADGIQLGNEIARDIGASHFQPVPEPSGWVLGIVAALGCALGTRGRRLLVP